MYLILNNLTTSMALRFAFWALEFPIETIWVLNFLYWFWFGCFPGGLGGQVLIVKRIS